MANIVENSLFGETAELQKEKLFCLIKNAISYGEWELAEASAKLYQKTAKNDAEDLQKLLLDVIKHPRIYSHGSSTIPTPFHLSWLAMVLYLELYSQEEIEDAPSADTRSLIEFKMFLLTLSKDLTLEQQQDSYCFFKLGLSRQNSLSKEYRSFISELAIRNPHSCRTLTDFLVNSMDDVQIQQNKTVVGDCYLRVLLSYIGRLQLFEESVQTMFLGECFPVIISAKEYFSHDSVVFINAISSVVKIILKHNRNAMNLLYCSLIDKDSIPFLMVALELSWKFKLNKLKLQDILEETIYGEIEQDTHVAELLSESFSKCCTHSMMTAFQICDYYNVHFLDSILNASLEMIKRKNYSKALEMLAPEPLQTLRPLVILLAWPHCSSYREKSTLLRQFFTLMGSTFEPTFSGACKRLEYNLKIGSQCFAKQRATLMQNGRDDSTTNGELVDENAEVDIFQNMEFHSVLYVLNKLRLLNYFHSDEIIEILKGEPPCLIPGLMQEREQLKLSEIRTYLRFSVLQHAINIFIGKSVENVALNNIKMLVQGIRPLIYRLETLEDLFSLLFVRKEHLSVSENDLDTDEFVSRERHPSEGDDEPSGTVIAGRDACKEFLFQQDAVKTYLDLLNEWIVELIAEKYSEKEEHASCAADSETCGPSSNFDRRISQLRQNVNHAIWRYELVSGCSSVENSVELSLKVRSSSFEEPSETSSIDLEATQFNGKPDHLLSQMLSSPDSLAHLCLQKGSLVQAQQVIKVFQLEDYSCGLAVDFAEVLTNCIETLKTTQPVEISSKPTQLTSIKSAAAAGLLSSNVRSSVNELLKHKSIGHATPDSPLEDIQCFAAIATCLDLVTSAELHSTVCKTILDVSEELIRSVDDSHAELKSLLMTHLVALKSTVHIYSQLNSNQLRDEMNDKTKSFSHFFTRSYRKHRGETTEYTFQKLTQQKASLEEIVRFIDEGVNEDEALCEDNKSETNPCRKCMNDTLAAYSSDSLVLIPEERARRNYIKTLFRHMDTLARLQLYFRTKHSGTQNVSKLEQKSSLGGIKAINPFVVLKDDISVIFGRLLFEWNMPPKRLESIAKQVNINLVKVVAKNFDLSIPVESKESCPDLATFLLTQPCKVLNACDSISEEMSGEKQHPMKLIEELVAQLLHIIKGLPSTFETHMSASQIKELVASQEFIDFQQKTLLLKLVDLKELENDEEKICFMINLYNLMFLHGVFIILSGDLVGIPDMSTTDVTKWTFECLMESPTGRLAIDQFLAYEIGQLGVISAFDLCRHILLGGMSSSYYGDAFKTRPDLFEWTPDWLAYAPSKLEKRSIFVLTHASASCPTFKFLKPEGLSMQLEIAKKSYLKKNVTVEPIEQKVVIPRLLHWHKDLFLARQPLTPGLQTASSLDFKDRNLLLLEFIKNSSNKICDKLENINVEKVMINIEEYNWKLTFGRSGLKSKKETLKYGKTASGARINQSFSLSEPIKKYLYDVSPVSASIICMALEKKKFLHQISEMIIESKYGVIKMGKQRISSLQKFIEDGIKSLSQSVEANAPFKAFTGLCCETILKILKSLQVDQPNASGKYVENVQSLIKVTVALLDVCGSINMESSEFLEELINVFLCHGGILISAYIETFPHMCPAKNRDRLLCESIYGIRYRLDDLNETCLAAGEDALKIDLDHITNLNIELKHCLMLLSDPYLRCKMTLESIAFFDVEEALEILEVCAEGCSPSKELVIKLKLEAEKIRWYDDLQKLFLSRFHDNQPSERVRLTKWQDCIDLVQYHPEDITILLIASGSFEQIDFWINNFSVPHHLSKICLRAKLHDILKDDQLEYARLYSVLDNLENKHVAMELCDDLLQSSEISTHHSLLLLRYMIENLAEIVSPDQLLQLRFSELGFKALDRFPEALKSSYWNLTAKPELVMEQLLMNMKVELAKVVIDIYRENVAENGPLSRLLGRIDEIIAVYAEKSLDVPIIETIVRKDSKLGTFGRKRSTKKHARSSSHQNISSGHESDGLKIDDKSANSSLLLEEKSHFRIPSTPVDTKYWVPDQSVSACQICKVQIFSTFSRRHHCRHCGRVSCASCSSYRCAVAGNPGKVRVCKDCFENVYSLSPRSGHNDENDQLPVQDAASHNDMPSSLPLGNTPATDNELEIGKKTEDGEFRGWQLTTDEKTNEEIRNHFCFDQAPSASLCVAIIEQCSDARKIGGLLLKFCNKLSQYLNERDSTRFHDIDNALLVRMIAFLNFNAKVKFMKAGFINGVELCDFEMAHVEVLRILLNSDWKELPTIQELAHPEVVRRLRDKIIDSERFALAIDVTGKCGLDPSTVWFAWGLSQLKSGDLKCARDNFSKCLTPLRSVEDKALQPNVLYLTQIVEIIENSPLLAYSQGDLLSPLYALQDLGRGSVTGCTLDAKRYEEIMYYLNKYGSHSQAVRFYVRNGLLKKAADYIRTQKCSPEIFFEDLLLKSFQIGLFEALARDLEDMDPTLNKWKEYLIKSCQYLSKKGLFNCLYKMQLFLKDYFRAATTCVRFFLGESRNEARSFKELRKRIYHLENAKKHLESLLKEKAIVKSAFVSHIGSQRTEEAVNVPLVQEVSVAELKNHLNTIDLQIKVLNFIDGRSEIFTEGKVPTLFGNGKERSDLVVMLLIESISNAFPLVSRIIQDYRLPAVAVFGDCVQKLIQKKDYDQIFNLIKTIEGTGMMPDKGRDYLLLKVINWIISVGESARQANPFVKMIRNQSNKVEALIVCGRLKDAYVEATKEDQVKNIERILQEAERLNQKYVADICQKYLKNFEEKQDRRGKPR